MVKLVDTQVLGTCAYGVGVRVPPWAPILGKAMSKYPKRISDNKWVVQVKEDSKTKDLYLEFPPGCLDQVGWDVGDDLSWTQMSNEEWRLSKK